MTVKELKKLLDTLSDDTVVVVPGYDHNYRDVRAFEREAEREGRGSYGEWYDGSDPNRKCIVLVIE